MTKSEGTWSTRAPPTHQGSVQSVNGVTTTCGVKPRLGGLFPKILKNNNSTNLKNLEMSKMQISELPNPGKITEHMSECSLL